jgi:hypothetical protein
MLEAALKDIRDLITLYSASLVKGTPQDLASYRELVGEIKGLMKAERVIADRLSKAEREE